MVETYESLTSPPLAGKIFDSLNEPNPLSKNHNAAKPYSFVLRPPTYYFQQLLNQNKERHRITVPSSEQTINILYSIIDTPVVLPF